MAAMEIDVESDKTSADLSVIRSSKESSSGKFLGYVAMMSAILEGIRQELDDGSLKELIILCQTLSLDKDLQTELMSVKSVMEVYRLLLKHTNNDFRQIIHIMNEFVPKIIYDLDPELRRKMSWLSEIVAEENDCFGLTDQSVLHGREESLEKLKELMNFDKSKDIRLINVCGMAGIGKSYLVKQFGSRLLCEGKLSVIYVDASGITQLSDLLAKMLEDPFVGRSGVGESTSLAVPLYDFLLNNKHCRFVLILDDLSTLMPESDVRVTKELFIFLNEFVKRSKKNRLNLKLLVTSQVHFEMMSEKNEVKELVPVKRLMADYIKDVPLGPLSDETSLKFLGPSLQSLTPHDRNRLMRLCAGHPYSLHIMSAIANSDFSHTTEISKVSSDDVDALNAELADLMFQKAFDRLTVVQRRVLLAVALFDRDAQLGALYSIVNPEETTEKFCSRVKEELGNGFWLTFRTCDIKSVANRRIVVNVHHPLIMKFLGSKIDSYLMDRNCVEYGPFIRMKERFITHHIDELIAIGKECVPQLSRNADFLHNVSVRFTHGRANFRISLNLILLSRNLSFLFFKGSDGKELRSPSDIAHLFLCFHLFHDSFDTQLLKFLKEVVNWTITDPRLGVLVWALYVMVLMLEQDWRNLDSILIQNFEDKNPKLISSASPDLYSFCKGIYGYATGSLYINASWLKESKDLDVIDKRKNALNGALSNMSLRHLSAEWMLVRKYFSTHILLVLAESTWLVNKSSITTIRESYALCKKAKECTQQVTILEPAVYSELASYRAIEGDEYDDVAKASELYAESRFFHNKVMQQYKSRKMERTVLAARNLNAFAVLMRSWGNRLVISCGERKAAEATERLKQAIVLGEEVIKIHGSFSFCSPSMRGLYKAYEFQGCCFYYLAEFNRRFKRDKSAQVRHQLESLSFYNKAYNLVKNDYRSCHLSANDPTLDRLMTRLPQLMRMSARPSESINKVCFNLMKVKEEAGKESEENINLSGSELYSSSEQESSDDELVDNAENLQLDVAESSRLSTQHAEDAWSGQTVWSGKTALVPGEINPEECASASKKPKM